MIILQYNISIGFGLESTGSDPMFPFKDKTVVYSLYNYKYISIDR